MGTASPRFLIPLDTVSEEDEQTVGGKAVKIAMLQQAGCRAPRGFCVTADAYTAFVKEHRLVAAIQMELGRKSFDEMRWEEIWDAALRIRSSFLAQPLSDSLVAAISDCLRRFRSSEPLAVRSSAIGEDGATRSFAGLHESILGVTSDKRLFDAIRLVWASLWSDAALLYRKELGLDPRQSRMAIIIQEMVDADRSGVAFGRDPRNLTKDLAIVESVPGPCRLLVDGMVDPDRWELSRPTGIVVNWLPGDRCDETAERPLLEPADLEEIFNKLLSIEHLFGWPADMEWTGRGDSLTVLQARPITAPQADSGDKRSWYLTLRPGDARLSQLRKRVADVLIPQLASEGETLAMENLDRLDDGQLAAAIEKRKESVAKWKKIYWDQFIPFAHGVRRLATFYNDAVQPQDPYEFVGLLRDQPLLATQRNQAIGELARQLSGNEQLRRIVESKLANQSGELGWNTFRDELLRSGREAARFARSFEDLNDRFLDIAHGDERLHDKPEFVLSNLVELSRGSIPSLDEASSQPAPCLEQRLFEAVGPERREEAIDVVETGRVSWRLRDDDNLLVARLESQLLRALNVAAARLRALGRLRVEVHLNASHAETLIQALREESSDPVTFECETQLAVAVERKAEAGERPRQLIGQPASPGVATSTVRCIRGRKDLGNFRQGEVLVCDAIQPTMTHLVPLASAIVERRGGMLIHGAIIARELGIPCVNGVRGAADLLADGDLVTVDGHLGIVTVGSAEFDLELGG